MGYAGAEGSLYIYKSFCQKSTSDRMKKPCDGIIEAGIMLYYVCKIHNAGALSWESPGEIMEQVNGIA